MIWASINPSVGGYQISELPALYRRIIERAEALPGVESATIAMCGLMTGCRSGADGLSISGYTPQPGEEVARAGESRRLALRRHGRHDAGRRSRFRCARHRAATRRVALINEAMARKYFKDRDPIGERFGYDTPDVEIVGVVRDARVNSVRESRRADGVLRARCDAVVCRLDARARHRRSGRHRRGTAQGAARIRTAAAGGARRRPSPSWPPTRCGRIG